MKTFKLSKKKGLTCGFSCECGELVQNDVIYNNYNSPNKMADSSFNQEVVVDVKVKCKKCKTPYTIEIFRDNENGWIRVWNDRTVIPVDDIQINVTQK